MNIAILSGKGGTGKTTVAANLAAILQANYIDCDVEEPNGFIFLKPTEIREETVSVDFPSIDNENCTLCGECAKVCQFNALFRAKKEITLFEKMCHGCHACGIVCESKAITFAKRKVGVVEVGKSSGITCKRGILDVGEPMAVPVIRSLLENLPNGTNLLDCSPGTSCNVVNTLHHAQGAILVTEPSTFGLHDLKMAIALVKHFNLPFGVIVNKWDDKGIFLEKYLKENGINILGYLPNHREAAEVYSRGGMLKDHPLYKEAFEKIARQVEEVFAW